MAQDDRLVSVNGHTEMMQLCPRVDPAALLELAREGGEESERWRRQLAVSRTINCTCGPKRVLAYTLFGGGRVNPGNVAEVGLYERVFYREQTVREQHSFETRYLNPLLDNLDQFRALFPEWVLRIYLEPDLEFLVPRLVRDHVEIFLMAETSNSFSGVLWRFLPADQADVACFLSCDADEVLTPHTAEATARWIGSGKPFFRFLGITPPHKADSRVAIEGARWGSRHDPTLRLGELVVGYALFQNPDNPDRVYTRPGFDTPGNYGFDESLLSHVIYYIACGKGMYTEVPANYIEDTANPTTIDLQYQRERERLSESGR